MITVLFWAAVVIGGIAAAGLLTAGILALIYRNDGKGEHAAPGDHTWPTFQAQEVTSLPALPARVEYAPTAVHQWAAEAWRAIGAVPAVPYRRYEPDALDVRVAEFVPPADDMAHYIEAVHPRVVAALTRAGSEDTIVRMSDLEPMIGGDVYNGLGRDGYIDQFDAIAARARDRLALIRVSVTA